LFDRIRISMPQNSPGSLKNEQNADIMAYMLFKAGIPSGKTELPSQSQMLRMIKFLAAKPAAL
jgi:hypothetical protein